MVTEQWAAVAYIIISVQLWVACSHLLGRTVVCCETFISRRKTCLSRKGRLSGGCNYRDYSRLTSQMVDLSSRRYNPTQGSFSTWSWLQLTSPKYVRRSRVWKLGGRWCYPCVPPSSSTRNVKQFHDVWQPKMCSISFNVEHSASFPEGTRR